MFATVSEKGQVTLPKKLRDLMGIQPGARLDFQVAEDGTLRVRLQARGADSLFGLLARPGQPALALEQMDQAVTDAVRARSGLAR